MAEVHASDQRAKLYESAHALRRFMEPVWLAWQSQEPECRGATPSANTCGRTSLFVRDALRLQGYPARWANGVPRLSDEAEIGPFGFLAAGRWEAHAWVISEEWIIDITADQFGADPVIVTRSSDPRYASNNRDTADGPAIARRRATAATLIAAWRGCV